MWAGIYTPGIYTLYLTTDDGAGLWVDGIKIAAVNGVDDFVRVASANVTLAAGPHSVKV